MKQQHFTLSSALSYRFFSKYSERSKDTLELYIALWLRWDAIL